MSRSLAASAAILLLCAGTSGAHAMSMNGTFAVHYDKQSPQPIAPEHVKIEQSGSGMNKSPGQPLDNAQVTLSDQVTLVKGQGPVKGTITFTTPNGSLTSTYTGKVMTDAQGRMTSQGKFRTVSGTGGMATIRGSGTYANVFSSQADMTSNWQGTFKDTAAKTARR